MKVEYSEQAVADLHQLATKSIEFGELVAEAVEVRINEVITQIVWDPRSYRKVTQRPEFHVAPLGKFPYVLFYWILEDRIRILHVRHTSRRPWKGK